MPNLLSTLQFTAEQLRFLTYPGMFTPYLGEDYRPKGFQVPMSLHASFPSPSFTTKAPPTAVSVVVDTTKPAPPPSRRLADMTPGEYCYGSVQASGASELLGVTQRWSFDSINPVKVLFRVSNPRDTWSGSDIQVFRYKRVLSLSITAVPEP